MSTNRTEDRVYTRRTADILTKYGKEKILKEQRANYIVKTDRIDELLKE